MTIPTVCMTAMSHYLGRGIRQAAAAGIVATLYYGESQLNPGSQGVQSTETPGALNPSGAYGIASWNGPRQARLLEFATVYLTRYAAAGTDPKVVAGMLNCQLDFVLTEIWNYYAGVKAAILDTAQDAVAVLTVFVQQYEVPANPAAEIARSQAGALEMASATIEATTTVLPTPTTPTPTASAITLTPTQVSAFTTEIADAMASFSTMLKQLQGVVS